MGTVGAQEAYQQGQEAYENGVDLFNVPGYYTEIEKELWYEGFINASNSALAAMSIYNYSFEEDDWKENDEEDELDFDK
jgi:hypothetical protein